MPSSTCKTWGIQGRSEVWVGEQSGKTQDRGEVVPATDCVVECASVAPKGNEKYVALTFDEGPSGATKQILQVLKEKGVTATFFLSGDAAEASPATAKAIVDAGCESRLQQLPRRFAQGSGPRRGARADFEGHRGDQVRDRREDDATACSLRCL